MTKLRQTLKERWQQLKAKVKASWKKPNNLALVVILAAPVVILSVTLAFVFEPAEYSSDETPNDVPDEQLHLLRHPLTGEFLDQELENLPQVFGVMVENSADAWPLSGLDQAFLVIEAPVEGLIPRFLAFYSTEDEVDKIGPVRSARPYYLNWNHELDGIYAHVGGSPEALGDIHDLDMIDLNEFSQGEYFWRDPRRGSPHNVYTSTDELRKSLLELKPEAPSYDTWLYKNETPIDLLSLESEGDKELLSVVVDWGQGSLYDIKWRYQPETNDYVRLQNNRLVKMSDGEQVMAKNILVIASSMTVLDSLGRLRIESLGEGDALLVQDGKIILGTWTKPSSTERLRIFSEAGEELSFNPGVTWVEVVESLDKVSTVSDL